MKVTQDTRKIKKGVWFVPVRGENFDGHDFVAEALQKGAAGVLELPELFAQARQKITELKPTVIAITGSYGKTTTKEALYRILNSTYSTYRTAGNLNTPLGIALEIINHLQPRHRFLIVEMGMDRLGEIKESCEIAHPQVGVLTNIGEMHLEKLGTMENIVRAKLELLHSLPANGLAILNADDPQVLKAGRTLHRRKIWFGNSPVDTITKESLKDLSLPILGLANQENILAAWAVGLLFGIPKTKMRSALKRFTAPSGRLRVFTGRNGSQIIDDTYNAGPRSMREALVVLNNFPAQRRIAVLGDMLELGPLEVKYHREVAGEAAEIADLFVPIGERMTRAVQDTSVPNTDLESLRLRRGDVVLVKGSRGMKMERIVANLKR